MIKKFENTSTFEVKSGRERKSIASMSVENVAATLEEGMCSFMQTSSVRVPVITEHKILRYIQNWYPDKITHVQKFFLPGKHFCSRISCSHGSGR